MAQDQWTELTLSDILDAGISPYPEGDLPEFTQAAVASWRMGDYGAAMWLYWDPDDLALPITHEIELARWQDGRWRPVGDTATAPAPGRLAWRPTAPIEWTATAQILLPNSTLWVLGGVARDDGVVGKIVQPQQQLSVRPDAQSQCLLIGVEVPPVATVIVDSAPPRALGHWSGPGD